MIKKLTMCFSVLCLIILSACSGFMVDDSEIINIAIPYEAKELSDEDKKYQSFLEQELGMTIVFTLIPASNLEEYLQILLTSPQGNIDGVIFTEAYTVDAEKIEGQDMVLALNDFIENDSVYFKEFTSEYEKSDIVNMITSQDEKIYYMPSVEDTFTQSIYQTMWINVDWLDDLGLAIPQNTQEFAEVLSAFEEYCPEGATIISSNDDESSNALNFLMNAFEICDYDNNYMAYDGDEVYYAPLTDGWREGLLYLNELYSQGLIPEENFTYGQNQFVDICNDTRNVVGIFCAREISDVLSENSPELLSYYMSVQPLSSENHDGLAVMNTPTPTVGGFILSESDKAEQVFELLDFMCSEQAFLYANYGEQGTDWDYSKVGDVSTLGSNAKITVSTESTIKRNSEQFSVIGPNLVRQEYANNVAWIGYQVNQNDYLDARAYRLYEPYFPEKSIEYVDFNTNQQAQLEKMTAYVKNMMTSFIKGEIDITDDYCWDEYLANFEQFNVQEIIDYMQEKMND